ncbi:L-threonylcarbamoyladenylate synthase [Desulfofalx alkaliphila]|uniref:L-threonylcarbamoyladenylate synthase n=1 Tax=Desulfofalx alkaliphila TaxID=105483 RepID=UPI0004E19A06|nr:L-threonylcarbamoyladenylate synthase [Desulfofalx alkaliphila]
MSEFNTRHWKIEDLYGDRGAIEAIKEAGEIIRRGGLVAFPTETVYGLGANALDGRAVEKIFKAKGRPADNPLIVHICERQQMGQVAVYHSPSARELTEKLIDAFWPGPLTLVLPKTDAVPKEVTAGLDTVAVRMPNHPVALELIAAAGVPVAAPSANLSGSPSPTTAAHVMEDLRGRIQGVLDGGPADLGVESTVLDITAPVPTVLRPGGVTAEHLKQVIGQVSHGAGAEKPRSPGLKYKHYSPKARLVLVEGDGDPVAPTQELISRHLKEGKRVGVLASQENAPSYGGAVVLKYGSRSDFAGAAATLYAALRQFDALGVDLIIAEGVAERGLGRAVMDRLRRAANGNIVKT